jgi:hypothetical protein
MPKRPSDLVIALSKGGGKGSEEWEGSDRESIAEALADSGALVVQNLNKVGISLSPPLTPSSSFFSPLATSHVLLSFPKGVDVLVASCAKDESPSVQKAKKLKISIANISLVKEIQKAGEGGAVDLKPHLLFEGDNKKDKGEVEDKEAEEEEEEESEDEEDKEK